MTGASGIVPGPTSVGAGLLLDTNAWAWSLFDTSRLTAPARLALDGGRPTFLSVVSFYEVTQKVRLGKWPEMERHVRDLPGLAERQGSGLLPVTAEVAVRAGLLEWPHRDPFDRLIVATAQLMGLALVSSDPAFDAVPGGVTRVW